jgi:hypothetical protein
MLILIKIYSFDKFTFNKSRVRKFSSNNNGNNIIVYIAPSNFNSIIDEQMVPDKFHDLMELLKLNQMSPKYLLRYYVESTESLKYLQILRNDSILQVRLKITKLFHLCLVHKIIKPISGEKPSNGEKSSGILADFLDVSLEDTLRQTNPTLIFSIGVTQDFLTVTNRLGIKVIEVMHGAFYDHEVKREWGNISKKKPDLVLTWHDHYTDILKSNNVNAITLGYPNPQFVNRGSRVADSSRFLVTLGYNEADSQDPFGVFDKKLMSQVLELKKSGAEMLYRMHPVVANNPKLYRRVLHWMNKEFENPEIHSPFEWTVFSSFQKVNFHVTKSSSTYFEASLLSIPTIFTDEIESLDLPKQFLDSGIAIQGGSLKFRDLSNFMETEYAIQAQPMNESDFYLAINQVTHSDS